MSNESVVDQSDADLLEALIRKELSTIPVSQWGYFFPAHVGVWRFLERKRPGAVGPLKAGYRDEPYFEGFGSDWFVEHLANDEDYISSVETIMYSVADHLAEEIRKRDSFLDNEIPALPADAVQKLAVTVVREADARLGTLA